MTVWTLAHRGLRPLAAAAFAAAIGGCASIQPVPPVAAEQVAGPLGAEIDAYLADRAPSGAFLIAQDGKVLLSKGYGRLGEGRGPITAHTVFPIGSISKQFTAAAVLKLAETGRLRLDDPIARFFPEAPADKRDITVHQLLSHTSGLPRNVDEFKAMTTREVYLSQALGAELAFAPGSRHAYSNTGYMLLALLVERASGRTFDDYLQAALFAPAGLVETGFPGPRFAGRDVPDGYDRPKYGETYSGTPLEEPYAQGWYRRGAGGLLSTVSDLQRWAAALRGGKVLSPAWAELLFTPMADMTPDGRFRYGYGWVVQDTRAGRKLWHNGVWFSYYSELWLYPDRGLVAVGFTNRQQDETFDETFRTAVGKVLESAPAAAARAAGGG